MKTLLFSLVLTLGFTSHASAQSSYAQCDVHMVNSTACGHIHRDGMGQNFSTLMVRERNDTIGLTYLALECKGDGGFAIFVESKNPLVSQNDADAGRTPKVFMRSDNGPLKPLKAANVKQLSADGEALTDLNTIELHPDDSFAMIKSARNRVQVVVQRLGGWAPLTYDFPIYGFFPSLKMLNSCRDD